MINIITEDVLIKTITETAKEWLYDTKEFVCYMDINSGSCGEFAWAVMEKLPKDSGVEVVSTNSFMTQKGLESYGETGEFSNHVWLLFEGKHYDIERINGVENYMDLPYFQREIKCKEIGVNEVQIFEVIRKDRERYKNLICDTLI